MKLIFYPIILLTLMNCKSSSINTENNNSPSQEITSETVSKDSVFVVSFYSIGGGINSEAYAQFDQWISTFDDVSFTKIRWGMEGEIDFCIDIKNKSTEFQSSFIQQVKDHLENKKHIRILEKSICKSN